VVAGYHRAVTLPAAGGRSGRDAARVSRAYERGSIGLAAFARPTTSACRDWLRTGRGGCAALDRGCSLRASTRQVDPV
jgi:hypothetical protein